HSVLSAGRGERSGAYGIARTETDRLEDRVAGRTVSWFNAGRRAACDCAPSQHWVSFRRGGNRDEGDSFRARRAESRCGANSNALGIFNARIEWVGVEAARESAAGESRRHGATDGRKSGFHEIRKGGRRGQSGQQTVSERSVGSEPEPGAGVGHV